MKRKGWFKKARKKFVKERVFRWVFREKRSYPGYEIEYLHNSRAEMRWVVTDSMYQDLNHLYYSGFTRGFWEARRLAKNSTTWRFYWDRKNDYKEKP